MSNIHMVWRLARLKNRLNIQNMETHTVQQYNIF